MVEDGIGITNYKKESIESLFKSNCQYIVPYFQREFSWKKKSGKIF